jgi:hypothetical protein
MGAVFMAAVFMAADAGKGITRLGQIVRMERFAMQSVNRWLEGLAVIACGISLIVPVSVAQAEQEKTFASPRQASNALYVAAQSGDQARLVEILGGEKQIISTGDELNDNQERELFAKKYQEMHRLARRSDGAMILYVGAENWPFPVPLVSKNGRWYFDSSSGSKEILYRRVGANEITAIETCHALFEEEQKNAGQSAKEGASMNHMPEDQALLQYAHAVVSRQGSADEHPFDGYNFRKMNESGGQGAYIAYPAEYRTSGVMTFVVTRDGKVYQKDLGPKTKTVATEIKDWKPDNSWYPADE